MREGDKRFMLTCNVLRSSYYRLYYVLCNTCYVYVICYVVHYHRLCNVFSSIFY